MVVGVLDDYEGEEQVIVQLETKKKRLLPPQGKRTQTSGISRKHCKGSNGSVITKESKYAVLIIMTTTTTTTTKQL